MMERSRKLSTQWTKHIKDKEAKTKFEQYVRGSDGVLEVLKDIAEKKILQDQKTSTEDYSDAAWPYRQADKAGYARALNEIITLITLE